MKIYNLILAGLISLAVNPMSGQPISEKRSFTKTMPFAKDGKVEIINKYGDIHVTSWNKDSVYIIAEIEAFAPNRSRLDKLLDGIEIEINGSGSFVRAETEFNREITVLLESFKGLTQKIIEYDSRVQINYFLNIPEYADIEVKNQFGDIEMENNSGIVSVTLSSGDFRANSLNQVSFHSLDFADTEIGSVRSCKINATFSRLKINESKELTINSTSTKYEFGKAENLNIESRRDKFFIKEASGLTGISYFTEYKIEKLTGDIDLTLKYGSFDIDIINAGFEKINLVSAYSDITLKFDASASFLFDIRHTNAFLVLPDKNIRSEKESLNEDKKEYLFSGTIGTNPGTAKVKIDATRGNIYLK